MQRQNGFTLIEITIAIVILVVALLIAVPSLTGVLADRRLRRSRDDVNRLGVQAQERSISERRAYLIVWRDKQFALRRKNSSRRGSETGVECEVAKGGLSPLSLPAAIEEEPPSE
jgi:prepilin-type N-terminal cleavage/methylation domain-containing protein